MAAPAAASAGRAAAGKVAGSGAKAAAGGAGGASGGGAATAAGTGGKGPRPQKPQKGDWTKRSQQDGGGKKKPGAVSSRAGKLLKGDAGKYRRMMIAEFIVCVILLGLSPLAKAEGEMGPIRFMKRGSATCALFIVLGLLSSAGKGPARAASMFGAMVTLVLLVDQREAFGKLAATLNQTKDDTAADAADFAASQGPDDSTALPDDPGVAMT